MIQLYYILVVHQRLRTFKPAEIDDSIEHPVSVIVCARNEEKNLRENLPLILEQEYPDFEVVVVNDCSHDDSKYVLDDFALKYKNLKVVTIAEHDRFRHGKKFAVTLGIKAAGNEYLLFTDADCRPESRNWLRRMQQNFSEDTDIILGYSPYRRLGGFVNSLIRLETFYTAINYLSFALKGVPYMGVGRNLAYKKSLFFKGKGFASHMHILSGDDDLFVNQHATAENTRIEIHAETHVWTDPKTSLSDYIKQKKRHFSAGKAYKAGHKQMLTLQAASGILFYILLITLLLMHAQWPILLAAFSIRMVVQLIVYYPLFVRLNYKDLFWWLPILDFIYYIYIFALNSIALFNKEVKWR